MPSVGSAVLDCPAFLGALFSVFKLLLRIELFPFEQLTLI
jgi:hypothetical protein